MCERDRLDLGCCGSKEKDFGFGSDDFAREEDEAVGSVSGCAHTPFFGLFLMTLVTLIPLCGRVVCLAIFESRCL